jgi:hypothetical protein
VKKKLRDSEYGKIHENEISKLISCDEFRPGPAGSDKLK